MQTAKLLGCLDFVKVPYCYQDRDIRRYFVLLGVDHNWLLVVDPDNQWVLAQGTLVAAVPDIQLSAVLDILRVVLDIPRVALDIPRVVLDIVVVAGDCCTLGTVIADHQDSQRTAVDHKLAVVADWSGQDCSSLGREAVPS